MKNREKYRNMILKGEFDCNEIKRYVLKKSVCEASCCACYAMLALWLDEEAEEPDVDWSKVAMDTPILVKCADNGEWVKRHFARYDRGKVMAFIGGTTSWTTETGKEFEWKYAKLADEGDGV